LTNRRRAGSFAQARLRAPLTTGWRTHEAADERRAGEEKSNMRLLLVEDHHDIAENVCEYLSARGHRIEHAPDGEDALARAAVRPFDVIVLDLLLPGRDGLSVCRALRNEMRVQTPVLMLTAKDLVTDKVAGFEAGADDYLVKPFSLLELEVRLGALARRGAPKDAEGVLRVAGLSYDPHTLAAERDGHTIKLNPSTRRLLLLLMQNSHRVVSRRELERELWGDEPPDGDVLRAHMYALRNAVDKPFQRKLLHTHHGEGYRLAALEHDE
jgi:DNA-binding response OmpR family regulator